MKKMLLLSAALIAVLTGPALAQRDGNRGDGQQYPNRSGRTQQAQPPAQDGNRSERFQRGQQQAAPQTQAAPQVQAQRDGDGRRDFNRGGDNNRRGFDRNNDGRPDFNRGNDNRRDFGRNDRYDNNRGWNNNRPGYNNRRFSQYYRNWDSSRRFRAGAYYRPQGFSYRRWSYGDILPSLFWGSRYWLNNYYAYDLPPPPAGTVWVRYGDDALLIDRYSGEVIQVSYSVFW